MTPDPLLTRIRAEFLEMPGLRLTSMQACRLWQLDPATCYRVLATLLDERFLYQTRDGSYVVMGVPRAAAANTALPVPFPHGARQRRSA